MRYSNEGQFRQQVRFLRRQFLQDGDLPFTSVLSDQVISQALTAVGLCWIDRIYSPLVTLWVFLGQVLSADPSCRAAVARLIAHRLSRGQRACSADRRLLPGAKASARTVLLERSSSGRPYLRGQRQPELAVETAPRPRLRWGGRIHARYACESGRLSTT